MNSLLERESLLRRMNDLQGYNKELENSSTILNKKLFGDISIIWDAIKEYENALQQRDDPVISQIRSYEPISKDNKVKGNTTPNNVEPTKGADKGK